MLAIVMLASAIQVKAQESGKIFGKITDKKTGETFTDLYSYKNGTISNFEIPNASGVVLNASSYFFDGPCSSSEDGEILFFSNNNIGPKDKQTLGVFYTIKETPWKIIN